MENLADSAQIFGIQLSKLQLNQFSIYENLLVDWNRNMNLTAIRDPQEIQIRHFLDALTCSLVTGDLNGRSLIDIGSGAGFPGIPLKILYPQLKLTLVESVKKKTRFLQTLVSEIKLEDVKIVADRAEVLGHNPIHREQYDWAAARAVADLQVLVEYLLPFCKVGGYALAQKGENAVNETAFAAPAIHQLGGSSPTTIQLHLPTVANPHFLITIPKISSTPLKFPRRVGVPSKRPL